MSASPRPFAQRAPSERAAVLARLLAPAAPDAPPSALRFYALMLWALLTHRRLELDEDAEPWG